MNRTKFFNAIRPSFGGRMTSAQVAGMVAILDAAEWASLQDGHHVANVFANVRRETGGIMAPIKETVRAYHKDKNPSDAEVIRRLDVAFAKGQLTWVKVPYWRDGAFGRGQVQISHWDNYRKLGRAIGVDLMANPAAALDPQNSARIAVLGMRDGMFTGLKLSGFSFPDDLRARPSRNPRRIVNGSDGSDREVAGFHGQFHAAIQHGGGWP